MPSQPSSAESRRPSSVSSGEEASVSTASAGSTARSRAPCRSSSTTRFPAAANDAASVRFICGTQGVHKQLENALSKFLGKALLTHTVHQLLLQAVFLKDCSFEAPNGPRVTGEWNPQISLDLNTAVNTIEGDLREVVLTVTVSAKQAERTVFMGLDNIAPLDRSKVPPELGYLEQADSTAWMAMYALHLLEIGGMWRAFRGLPITDTAYR